MRIVVLGASGQIGSVIHKGLKTTHQVVATSRKPSADLIEFDPFGNDWSALGKVDVLVNCVGQIAATRASSFHHIHVDLTDRIVKHREAIGNPRIIQVSALGASPAHKIEFLRTKGVADKLLLQHPNTTVVRPSIVCTPGTVIVRKMLMLANIGRFSLGLVPVPKGFLRTKIQPVTPQDLVDVVRILCTNDVPHIVNAVGPEAISFRQLVATMTDVRNQKLRLIEVPRNLADMMVNHLLSATFPNVINSQQYQLLFEDNVADAEPVKQMLGRPLHSSRVFFENEFRYASD